MKRKILGLSLLSFLLSFATVNNNTLSAQNNKSKKEMKQTTQYVCPHHPDKISNKPGKCACGMDLVAKKMENNTSTPKSTNTKKKTMKKKSQAK